jgi:predicted HTH domain antitoxin
MLRAVQVALLTVVWLMVALKMSELGKLSSGQAAQLAEITRVEFVEMCGRYHVPITNYSADELEAELAQDIAALCQR